MPNNPLTQAELSAYTSTFPYPQIPAGYFFASPPTGAGPLAYRLFDASYISIGIINPNRLGTGSTGAGNLYLADNGTWKSITIATPTLAQVTTAGNTTTNAITVGGLTVNTNLIYTDTVNSRVGIGTVTPDRPLHINSVGTTGLRIDVTGAGSNAIFLGAASSLIRWSNGSYFSNTGMYSGTNDQQYITFDGTNTQVRLQIKASNGNIGINTTTDAGYKLDVQGTTRIQSNLTVSSDIIVGTDNITNAWIAYTPIWSSQGGTQPNLGDGTLTGFYKKIGKTVFVRVKLNFGLTTIGGDGAWLFSLPVNAASQDGIQFPCSMLDNGFAWYQGIVNGTYSGFTDKSAIIAQSPGGANSSQGVSGAFPFGWGNGDSLQFNGSYECI